MSKTSKMSIKSLKVLLLCLSIVAITYCTLTRSNVGAYSSNPPTSRTGAPAIGNYSAELTCTTSCHNSYALNSGVGIFSINGLPTYYWPDQEVTITVSLNQASRSRYGFEMTAVDSTGKGIGTFTPADSRTQVTNGTGSFTGRPYIHHSASGLSATSTNQSTWTFKWKAPSTATGKVTFYAAGNAANGSGDSGDYIYTSNKSMDPLPFGTVSAASYDPVNVLTSEMIGSLFSVGLASQVVAATPGQALPTQLGDTVLEFQDSSGKISNSQLFFVAGQQINFLVPQNTTTGTAIMRVKRSGTVVAQGTVAVQQVSPGLFSATGDGKGLAAAFALRVTNGSNLSYEPVVRVNATTSAIEAAPIDVDPANGSVYLVLYGTGIRWRSQLSNVTVSVRGTGYNALYAGPSPDFIGLDQINIGPLPASLVGAGSVDIVVTADGKTSKPLSVTFK
jgi:uncharacterized protein (TIGR03437 family)